MRRSTVTWGLLAALVVVGAAILVAALNSTVYSASGFVSAYVGALQRQDAAGALELADVELAEGIDSSLLTRDAMTELDDVEIVGDATAPDGTHQVTVSYTVEGAAGTTTYSLERDGSHFGLFPRWSFAQSPLSTLFVSVLGDQRFTANGTELVTTAAGEPSGYAVFAPGAYVLDHETHYLESDPVRVPVDRAGVNVPTAVTARANQTFVDEVGVQVRQILDDCTTQRVLQPTGCPFGETIRNRILDLPEWSMTSYPAVDLDPTDQIGVWTMPVTDGVAHLEVDIQSLFDGSVESLDQDVPFVAGYTVTILSTDELLVVPR